MSSQNGTLPKELKELSTLAVRNQIVINESIEGLHQVDAQFLRVFNGASTDVEMIRERAQRVLDHCAQVSALMRGIVNSQLPE